MVRMVDDLMEVSRITRGQVELRNERAPLRRVLDDALEAVPPAIDSGQHRLQSIFRTSAADRGRPHATVAGVPEPARQRGQNTPPAAPSPCVRKPVGDQIEVSVRDTGIGIASDTHPSRVRAIHAGACRTITSRPADSASGSRSPRSSSNFMRHASRCAAKARVRAASSSSHCPRCASQGAEAHGGSADAGVAGRKAPSRGRRQPRRGREPGHAAGDGELRVSSRL